jgi:hypothetical protein
MRKSKFLFLFLVLALLLAACGSLKPPEAAKPFEPTATSEQVASDPSSGSTVTATPGKPECRVDTSTQVDPALEERFPKVSAKDWSQGPEDAYVSIIEYSDFQ